MYYSMRSIGLFITFIIISLLLGLLLAVSVYQFLDLYFDISFHRLVTRILSLCGFIFGFLYLKHYRILTASVTGFDFKRTGIFNNFIKGFLSGIGLIFVLECALLLLGIHELDANFDISFANIALLIIKAVLTGVAVGLLEESLFRGVLQGGLQEKSGLFISIFIISFIYAAVHFFNFKALSAMDDITWTAAIAMLPEVLGNFGDLAFLDIYLSLFVFGVLLSLTRAKNGNILQCIGLHAGVVFSIKISKASTNYASDNLYPFLANQTNYIQGYLCFAWVLLVTLAYYLFFFNARRDKIPTN